MSAQGAHLILGPRLEPLIRTSRSFERGPSFNIFQKKVGTLERFNIFIQNKLTFSSGTFNWKSM